MKTDQNDTPGGEMPFLRWLAMFTTFLGGCFIFDGIRPEFELARLIAGMIVALIGLWLFNHVKNNQ